MKGVRPARQGSARPATVGASRYARSLIEASLDPLVTISPEGKITDVNRATEEATGLARHDLVGTDFADYFTEPERAREGYRQVLERGWVRDYALTIRHVSGRTIDVLYNATVYRDEAGRLQGVFAAARDITDRKQAEGLRAHLAAIIESSSDAVIGKTLDGVIASWNRGAERIYGYSAAEMVGRPVEVLAPADRRSEIPRLIERIRRGEEVAHYETARVRKDGMRIDVSLTLSPIRDSGGALVGVSTIARDVTEQKRAAREARAASLYARGLIEASLDPLVTISPEGKITDVNRATEEATGLARDDLVGTDFAEYFAAPERAREGYRQVLDRGWVRDYALTIRHVSGRTLDVLYNATVYRDEAGRLQGVFAAARDVTERKRAEEALRERERALTEETRKLHSILDSMAEAVVVSDARGKLIEFNRAAEELHGVGLTAEPPERWGGGSGTFLSDGVTPCPPEQSPLARAVRGEKSDNVELCVKGPDGGTRRVEVTGRPILDAEGKVVGGVMVLADITARKRMEEQLRQSQRLEAIGSLAGGVAHDFNNLLTAIIGSCDLLLDRMPEFDPLREEAREIETAARRAATLTGRLLTFSRKQVVQPKVLDLDGIVAGMDKMLRRLIGENIELALIPGPTPGRVRADPGQLEQVIANLVVNARDAMPEGGRLTIETADVEIGEDQLRRHVGVKPGHYVLLAVTDTGSGMDAEVQSHLFEPFFTTKEVGKGSGLGLSTVYGIVKQAGGEVSVYSEPGRGSVFKVYLPRVEEAVEQAGSASAAGPPVQGKETVLLVEDEPQVRAITGRVLRGAGYTVLEATDGEEALRVVAEAGSRTIDALVTDVVMPRMGGPDLANRVRAERPGIKVLFVSGYTEHGAAIEGQPGESSAFLQKPFTPRTLAHEIRSLLDRGGGPGAPPR